MEGWMNRLARTLGEQPLSPQETATLLDVARDVAHRVERKVTPLSTFMLGLAVGRAAAAGASREDAMGSALGRLRETLPEAPEVPAEG
jgi:Domain of unknown function (DUF6457)